MSTTDKLNHDVPSREDHNLSEDTLSAAAGGRYYYDMDEVERGYPYKTFEKWRKIWNQGGVADGPDGELSN